MYVIISRVLVTKHSNSGLKQQKSILSWLGVQKSDQDVSRAMLPWKALEENLSLPLPASAAPGMLRLVATRLQCLPLSSQDLPLLPSVCLCVISVLLATLGL